MVFFKMYVFIREAHKAVDDDGDDDDDDDGGGGGDEDDDDIYQPLYPTAINFLLV